MAIDGIGVVTSPSASIPQNAGIGQTEFLKILLTQLQFQDPLKPVDNQQFVAQLAQFSGLEINRQTSEKIDTLLTLQNNNQVIGLIGRNVEVRTASGSTAGSVTAVAFTSASGQPTLTVKTSTTTLVDVRPSDITLVLP